jgi:hypothetical protein
LWNITKPIRPPDEVYFLNWFFWLQCAAGKSLFYEFDSTQLVSAIEVVCMLAGIGNIAVIDGLSEHTERLLVQFAFEQPVCHTGGTFSSKRFKDIFGHLEPFRAIEFADGLNGCDQEFNFFLLMLLFAS